MSQLSEIATLKPYLMRIAISRVGDAHRAEDVVQETMLAAYCSAAPFEGRARFRSWLTGILLHKVGDFFREKARDARMVGEGWHGEEEADDDFDAEGAWSAPVTPWSDPGLALECSRFRDVFNASFERLPPQQSRAFALRELEGLEVEEVCAAMRITPNNLSVLLHRARMTLRRSLDRSYFSVAA